MTMPTQTNAMFFIVRTDVTADSGMQRCFGAADTQEDAERLKAEIELHSRGIFEIFKGSKI